jgi:hypothetical protein
MEIYNATAKTKTDVLEISKGFANLAISTDAGIDEITTETASIYVERKGDTLDVCRDILLKDLILLGTESQNALVSMGDFVTCAVIDLTVNGGNVLLEENEKVKIAFSNLKAGKIYALNTIESAFPDSELEQYVRKTMSSESLTQDFDVRGYDLMSIQKSPSITEISLTFDSGTVVKMTPFELELYQKSLDPVVAVTPAGVLSGFSDRILYPLTGIVNVNIRKTEGTLINLSLKINQNDALLYNVKR